jgi:hypothetical protein
MLSGISIRVLAINHEVNLISVLFSMYNFGSFE